MRNDPLPYRRLPKELLYVYSPQPSEIESTCLSTGEQQSPWRNRGIFQRSLVPWYGCRCPGEPSHAEEGEEAGKRNDMANEELYRKLRNRVRTQGRIQRYEWSVLGTICQICIWTLGCGQSLKVCGLLLMGYDIYTRQSTSQTTSLAKNMSNITDNRNEQILISHATWPFVVRLLMKSAGKATERRSFEDPLEASCCVLSESQLSQIPKPGLHQLGTCNFIVHVALIKIIMYDILAKQGCEVIVMHLRIIVRLKRYRVRIDSGSSLSELIKCKNYVHNKICWRSFIKVISLTVKVLNITDW